MADILKGTLTSKNPVFLRIYAAKKVLCLEGIPPEERIEIIKTAYQEALAEEKGVVDREWPKAFEGRYLIKDNALKGFSNYFLGLLFYVANEAVKQDNGADKFLPKDIKMLAGPAFDGALSILMTSSDVYPVRASLYALLEERHNIAPVKRIRDKVIEALRAMPDKPGVKWQDDQFWSNKEVTFGQMRDRVIKLDEEGK
jgi:hypothetical protein